MKLKITFFAIITLLFLLKMPLVHAIVGFDQIAYEKEVGYSHTIDMADFIVSFSLTIIIELIFTLILLSFFKSPFRVIFYVLVANLISYPLFALAIYYLLPLSNIALLILEGLVFIFETLIIYKLSSGLLSLEKSLLLSFINNLFSFIMGSSLTLGIILIFILVPIISMVYILILKSTIILIIDFFKKRKVSNRNQS